MRNRSLTSTVILAACLVAAGVLAPVTALADGPLALNMIVGGKCVGGHKPSDQPITVKLLRSDGSTRSRRTDTTSDFEWRVCFSVPVAGSRVKMKTAFADVRIVRIPDLTAVADRVGDVVRGHAPAGRSVLIDYSECVPSGCALPMPYLAHANSNGRYHLDLSSLGIDIDGSDKIKVTYTNSALDEFSRRTVAPYIEISKPNKIRVSCLPKGTTTLQLRSSGSSLRATKSFTATKDCFGAIGSFKKNGDAVNVHVGDRITADFASDASLRWPAMSVTGQVGTPLFSGHCLKDVYYVMYPSASPDPFFIGTTDANGDFSGNMATEWTFQSGDELTLVCETSRGDRVRLVRTL